MSLLVTAVAFARGKAPGSDDDTILTPGSVTPDPHAPTRLALDDDDVLPPSPKLQVAQNTNPGKRTPVDADDVLPPGAVRTGKVSHPQNDDDVLEPGSSKPTGKVVFHVDLSDDDVLAPGMAKPAMRPEINQDDDDPRIRTYKTRTDDDDVLAPTFKARPASPIGPVEP